MTSLFKNPVHILHIGANWGEEVDQYIKNYRDTLQSITFIECIPSIATGLKKNMEAVSEREKIPIHVVEALVSDIPNTPCKFHLASNTFASSSMFEPNPSEWQWGYVNFTGTLELITTTCDELISKGELHTNYDAIVIDVQGAELKVLKGMTKLLPSVKQILTEYSTKEFYKGGVLFDELAAFLIEQGFHMPEQPSLNHGDIYFTRPTG